MLEEYGQPISIPDQRGKIYMCVHMQINPPSEGKTKSAVICIYTSNRIIESKSFFSLSGFF
jgi:hypothetical protein